MKRLIALLTALFLVVCMTLTAWADNGIRRVYDYEGILSDDDCYKIQELLDDASEHIGMDVVLLVDSAPGDAISYAEDFYDAGGFGTGDDHSGVTIFVDMNSRSVYMVTTGKAITYYTDDRLYYMTDGNDDLYECLADKDYVGAAASCTSRLTAYYDKGIESNQYTYNSETGEIVRHKSLTIIEIILALIVPALVGWLNINSIKKQYAMEKDVARSVASKLAYTALAGFVFAITTDELINHHVTQRVLPVASSGSSSGGSSSPTGNSGRSTIHTGSSGSFHGGGGGGRHF